MSSQPAVDYTNKDFASLRRAMLELARFRLPEWTDQSPNDLGVLLVDLFAYMGDIILYYQDRIASESFLTTASERRSVLYLLRLIGYELRPPIAAAADLKLTFNAPGASDPTKVTIQTGTQFATKGNDGPPQPFEYLLAPLTIDLKSSQVQKSPDGKLLYYSSLPVRQSRSVPLEILGSSTGEPNQAFKLSQGPLIVESLEVSVDEGAGWTPWARRESLLYYTDDKGGVTLAGPNSKEFYVQFDEHDAAWVVFGDGIYGRIPTPGTGNIRAQYRVGGGMVGNVPTGAISVAKTSIAQLKAVTNPAPAAGGADRESLEHAIRFGPLAFRSGYRSVTLNDFVSLAHQAGGVAKVRARTTGWNQIDLFIAPEGDVCAPPPEDLKKRLVAFFEDKRMVGTFIRIQDPSCISIDISLKVLVEHYYNPEMVRYEVTQSVSNLLAFKNVEFGRPLYLSKVYEAVEALAGVQAVTVSRFRRKTDQAHEIATDGRIDIGDFELPKLGVLNITVE